MLHKTKYSLQSVNEIVVFLKKEKPRILAINHSDIKKHDYVRHCFDDIGNIPKFGYTGRDVNSMDNRFFGFVYKKKLIYIFFNLYNKRILFCDYKNYVKDHEDKYLYVLKNSDKDYEFIKGVLEEAYTPIFYIERLTTIKKIHKIILCILIGIVMINILYNLCTQQFDINQLALIGLNCTLVMSLQDAINICATRIEQKRYDLRIVGILILEIVLLACSIPLIFISGKVYTIMSWGVTMLGILILLISVIFKFDKVRTPLM